MSLSCLWTFALSMMPGFRISSFTGRDEPGIAESKTKCDKYDLDFLIVWLPTVTIPGLYSLVSFNPLDCLKVS
jgi:hypothetical protein